MTQHRRDLTGALSRVALISYHSSPLGEPGSGDSGGMTVYVREIAEAQARLGIRTDIFTRHDGRSPRVTELSRGVRVVSVVAGPEAAVAKGDMPLYLRDFAAGIEMFARSQGLEYDLVHSHYWQSGLAGKQLAETWGVPLVHSHHTLGRVKNHFLAPGDIPEPQSRLSGEADVISAADVLIASTDDEWEHLACLYCAPHDRLKTIHPGVDHEVFSPGDRAAARNDLGLSDELVMLSVGRIQPLKGLQLAIRATDELRSALERKLVLLVVGGASGPAGDRELRRLHHLVRELDLEDEVRFVGPQPHAKLPVFYRAADALVVCSHSESFGLAALEAHACATPVVGTAVGGLAYVVRDGRSGFLIDTRDPSIFAARLKTLLADDALRSQFGRCAAQLSAEFSWDKTARESLELYECLARERSVELCTC